MSPFLWAVLFASTGIVVACCFVLVFSREYHAGLVGKVGLGFVALAAFGRLAALWDRGLEAWVSPQGVMLWLGLALFIGRHAVKFLLRCSRRGPTWYEPIRGGRS